jgi:hypothetical protein
MSDQAEPGSLGPDDRQAEAWLATLRDGSPDEKAAARRGLAAHFETQGMAAEAIDLLVANARAGYRDVEGFQALSRLYRAQGNEYLAASAALEATRLSGRRAEPGRRSAPAEPVRERTTSNHAPWGQDARPRSQAAEPARGTPGTGTHAAWRRPIRIIGWLGVVVTALAALGVSSTSAISAGLYLVSAAVLGLVLSGSLPARRLLRLPDGPLGDGALLFGWLLLLLVAGAILPRGPDSVGVFTPAAPIPTTSIYRTPAASVTATTGGSPTP